MTTAYQRSRQERALKLHRSQLHRYKNAVKMRNKNQDPGGQESHYSVDTIKGKIKTVQANIQNLQKKLGLKVTGE